MTPPVAPLRILRALRRPLLVFALLLLPAAAHAPSLTRWVNAADSTCGGHAPCYATIQAAVAAAQAGDTIQIQAGTYVEQVSITGKNNVSGASEADRIVIEADPALAPGSVVLRPPAAPCLTGYAVLIRESKFVTLRGLTITGAVGAGVVLLGGPQQNHAVHLERDRIVGNGSPNCPAGGIVIALGNPDTLIVNTLIHGNGGNGISLLEPGGGPHWLIQNTLHGNGWNGVGLVVGPTVMLVNNLITSNGQATGTLGGRRGVWRIALPRQTPQTVRLLHNLICGNRGGELAGPLLDATDAGNLTPTGSEGLGVSARPGCETSATVYANLNGLDGQHNTVDDDFTLASDSPAIDQGINPRTLGLDPLFTPLLEADYAGAAARPRDGDGTAEFDIGAIERVPPDTQPPGVTFLSPPASAFVRGTLTIEAHATDPGSGVASLTLSADSQSLSATLVPTPPAASVTGAASWNTLTVADGAHTLTATATDQTGNLGAATTIVTVDNTAADTQITNGPSGTITATSATFTFAGSDNLTPQASLEFAWRLDGGAFTAFGSVTSATFTNLTEGAHTFEVKARDQAGNEDPTPASQAFTVSQLRITITEPSAGATVPAGLLLVRGTVEAGSIEVGVTVNNLPAAVHGTTFAALVPVAPSVTHLAALATDAVGATASATMAVTVQASDEAPVLLRAVPASGVAPLTVSFNVSSLVPVAQIALDLEGDGSIDFQAPSFDGQGFLYSAAGLYFPTVIVIDTSGATHTATAVLQVYDLVALDTLLQVKWTAMKDALRRGDVSTALQFIVSSARPRYQGAFATLVPDLPAVDSILAGVTFVRIRGQEAIYEMVRTDAGIQKSFEVRFGVDVDGLWRLRMF